MNIFFSANKVFSTLYFFLQKLEKKIQNNKNRFNTYLFLEKKYKQKNCFSTYYAFFSKII
jgi:hypothetical protein